MEKTKLFWDMDETNGRLFYVSIQDIRFFKNEWLNHVLYREMKTETDWVGGANHYCRWSEIGHCVKGLSNRRRK